MVGGRVGGLSETGNKAILALIEIEVELRLSLAIYSRVHDILTICLILEGRGDPCIVGLLSVPLLLLLT